MRAIIAAILATILVGFFTGDLIQQQIGLRWQHDGGHEGDAGDTCDQARPSLTLGEPAEGLLVPRVDEADYYLLPVPASAVRTLVTVRLVEVQTQLDANLTVFAPGCTFDLAQPPQEEGHGGGNGERHGHTKCHGQGHKSHSECLVSNITVGDDELSFVPLQPVVFVVAATLNVTALPLPGLEPAPQTCHQSCLTDVLGYRLDPS